MVASSFILSCLMAGLFVDSLRAGNAFGTAAFPNVGALNWGYETRSQPFLTIRANVVLCVQLLPIHTTCSI